MISLDLRGGKISTDAKNLLYILFEALLALFQSLKHTYAHTRLPVHTHTHTHARTHKHTINTQTHSLTPCHLGKQPENLFSSSFSSNRIKSSFHSKFFFPTKKLFQSLELFQCWGLHSAEVAYLCLTQQPQVWFSVFPKIFHLMLLRFIDGAA